MLHYGNITVLYQKAFFLMKIFLPPKNKPLETAFWNLLYINILRKL